MDIPDTYKFPKELVKQIIDTHLAALGPTPTEGKAPAGGKKSTKHAAAATVATEVPAPPVAGKKRSRKAAEQRTIDLEAAAVTAEYLRVFVIEAVRMASEHARAAHDALAEAPQPPSTKQAESAPEGHGSTRSVEISLALPAPRGVEAAVTAAASPDITLHTHDLTAVLAQLYKKFP